MRLKTAVSAVSQQKAPFLIEGGLHPYHTELCFEVLSTIVNAILHDARLTREA
jgi:hypothetical protein